VQFSELPSAHLHLLIFLFIRFPYSPCCYQSCGNEHIKAISSRFFTAPVSSLPPLPLTLILIATVPFFTVAFFLILKGVSLFLDFLLQRTFEGMLGHAGKHNTDDACDTILGQAAKILNAIVLIGRVKRAFMPATYGWIFFPCCFPSKNSFLISPKSPRRRKKTTTSFLCPPWCFSTGLLPEEQRSKCYFMPVVKPHTHTNTRYRDTHHQHPHYCYYLKHRVNELSCPSRFARLLLVPGAES